MPDEKTVILCALILLFGAAVLVTSIIGGRDDR